MVVKTLQERAQTLEEMAERALFFYRAPKEYDEVALSKFDRTHLETMYGVVIYRLSAASGASAADYDAIFKDICTENGWKMPQVGQPLRIALSGGTQAPGIGEIVEALGIEESIRRIQAVRGAIAGA
jgi:glutamyl-tRNA synthetase